MARTSRKRGRRRFHRDSALPYIADKDTYKAVQYARWLMNNTDMPTGVCIWKAGEKYDITASSVAHYLGKLGSNVKAKKRRMRRRGGK